MDSRKIPISGARRYLPLAWAVLRGKLAGLLPSIPWLHLLHQRDGPCRFREGFLDLLAT